MDCRNVREIYSTIVVGESRYPVRNTAEDVSRWMIQ